jgi:hypothetical protein
MIMAQEKVSIERVPAPYAAPANVMAILQRFRERDLPDEPFTPKFLEDLGVPAGNVHRTLRAFEFLGLLDGGGAPTEKWRHLRVTTDDEFASALALVLQKAYADVFKRVDPSKDSQVLIENVFRRYSPAAQRSRMVTLFLSLCREAGIPTLDTPRKRETKQPIAGSRRNRPPVQAAPVGPGNMNRWYGGGTSSDLIVDTQHPLITGLLKTLPKEAGWTKTERDQWLNATAAVLDLLYPAKSE